MIYEKRERVVFWLDLVLRAFLVWVVLTILLKTLHLDLPDLSGVVPHIRIPGRTPGSSGRPGEAVTEKVLCEPGTI